MNSTQINDSKIAETAFLLWLDDGKPEGRDQEHWFRARTLLESSAPPAKARRRAAPRKKAADPATAPKAAAPKVKTAKPRSAKAKAAKA